jgi:O-methyltransferase
MQQAPSFRSRFFWGVRDHTAFNKGLDELAAAANVKNGWYAGDNLIAFGRNLGFLTDKPFIEAWQTHATSPAERGVLWRYVTSVWAARQAARLEGDFVECGCYKGATAHILLDTIDLSARQYFLYDLFEHDASMQHHAMPEHSAQLYDQVKARFEPFPNVHVIKGSVPDSFAQGLPERVAFAHIDMNNVQAEIGALEVLADRFIPGAMIVLDDFGQTPYRAQHLAETTWFKDRGRYVLELPTSQGLVIW